ncbi:MAG: hypothetical protein IJC26_01130 [Clostridia bacterium]|nr:hypothetical protein [Clostridia bacterium]
MTAETFGYVLEATGDDRDRTREIEELLEQRGCCVLGTGRFYVSGIMMPEHSTLMGLGEASLLVLASEVEEGYTV